MTETSFATTAIPAPDRPLSIAPSPNGPLPAVPPLRPSAPIDNGIQEDDGQISCECGFFDDDGSTVACDACNRWQHQLCYYPQFEDRPLPDDLQHFCVDCRPRPFDSQGARARQRVKREEQASLVNGIKRPSSKSHKKKVKEPTYTNGWPLDKARHDRNSASPRDLPPPAKRPKTSHRASDSTTSAVGTKGHSRKRTASNVNHRRSLSRSPDTPVIDLYSSEFVLRYREDDWTKTNTNLHSSIAVTNSLSEWLTLPDDEFREMHGHNKAEVLMRWDGELDDIPGKAEIEIQDVTDDRIREGPLAYPTWKMLTVKESIANGAYIGELKGHVGFKEDYVQDPSNRWSLLRHPQPFAFFHPRLPIYIDARDEGTELRYVRRSCSPNAQLQVLVTDQTDYRFCFMATQQIDPGMEIAVPWDTSNRFHQFSQGATDGVDLAQLSVWVSNVLSNCGPCACQREGEGEGECFMARFDKRIVHAEGDPPQAKPTKPNRKKGRQNISPLNTQVNSRSGSEARKVELEDEPTDSRSTSGSTGRGSASRDITPNTHFPSLASMPELSERERKKLAKEEEMFRRQEEEQSGRQTKKKRNSGGSSLNTPSTTSSRQLGFQTSSKYADAGTSKQTGLPIARPNHRSTKGTATPKARKTITRVVKRPTPNYVDAEVQCDLETEIQTPVSPPQPRRPFLSTTLRLLQRCAINNTKRKRAVSTVNPVQSAEDPMDVDVKMSPITAEPQSAEQSSSSEQADVVVKSEPAPVQDTEMEEASPKDIAQPDEPGSDPDRLQDETSSASADSIVPSHLPTHPSAPPWPSQASHSARVPSTIHRPPDMHLQMPPPPTNPFEVPLPSALISSATTPGSIALSPASLTAGPLFSPSVVASVNPSPARKKMSLSDYTRRTKAKDHKEVETKPERDGSPPVSSTPATVGVALADAPALPTGGTSLSSSEDGMKVSVPDSSSTAVDGDAKMEDVGDAVTVAAAAAAATAVAAPASSPTTLTT